jgi:hypothetical protein
VSERDLIMKIELSRQHSLGEAMVGTALGNYLFDVYTSQKETFKKIEPPRCMPVGVFGELEMYKQNTERQETPRLD